MSAETRIEALQRLLREGVASTQEDLRHALNKLKFRVTQSTISRDLRRIGAVRAVDTDGQVVYRLGHEELNVPVSTPPRSLVVSVEHNGQMIVVHTTPGSASLLARVLDKSRAEEILGTIAGDDTIFIAPRSIRRMDETVTRIHELLAP